MAQSREPHRARRRVRFGRVLVVCAAGAVGVAGALIAWRIATHAAPEAPPEVKQAQPAAQLVVEPAPRPAEVVAFEEGCVSAECHASFIDAPGVHAPVAEGACDACHLPDGGGHVYPQRDPRWPTCSTCHDTASGQLFQHKAMSDDACLACHDPHMGRTRALLLEDSVGATCVRCHPASTGGVQHPPYEAGSCENCHAPHGAANRDLLLGGEGAGHCGLCHMPTVQVVAGGDASHGGLQGSCLACHASHSADHESLLVAETRDLCVSCHPAVGDLVALASVSHDAVLEERQCISCHDPHDARRPGMLRERQQDVCLACHDGALEAHDGRTIPPMADALAAAPVVHGAVRHGDCSACHSVHGGTHARLLREIEPTVLPGPDAVRHYTLCFACHDPTLATAAASTRFRDGDRNLHAAHLESDGGASACSACHAVHSGNLPRLIAETVNYEGSDWRAPMGFELAPEGGRCAPACHEPMSYRRTNHPPPNGGSP